MEQVQTFTTLETNRIQSLYSFDNKQEEQLFNKISKELRCTVCQNQSLFDSMAPIAIDLRREIYRQVQSGQREEDIIQFVVSRYGEDVLYNPPWQVSTSFLWLGPLLMLILGSALIIKYIRGTTATAHSKNMHKKP